MIKKIFHFVTKTFQSIILDRIKLLQATRSLIKACAFLSWEFVCCIINDMSLVVFCLFVISVCLFVFVFDFWQGAGNLLLSNKEKLLRLNAAFNYSDLIRQ